jgi:hypothetical protein
MLIAAGRKPWHFGKERCMEKMVFDLQLFADGGGDGSASGTAAGSASGTAEGEKSRGDSLSDVIYGKQESTGQTAAPEKKTETAGDPKTKSQMFEDLIRGEYREEFQKRTQGIIDRRFRESKGLEEKLQSHDAILNMLAEKYGVEADNVAGLRKAIEDDESFFEKEALERGLTVKQLKEMKRLERENEEFRKAAEQQEMQQRSQQIYSQWLQQAQEFKDRYGLAGFSLEEEVKNPDFVNLLRAGISVESAYKAVHMDDMIGGAMAKTASEVREKMANSISSRQNRAAENGISSPSASQVFKTDVRSLTKADRDEIDRRVMRGAVIRF